MTMPGKNKIALNGFGRLGLMQTKALLISGVDSLEIREKANVPQMDFNTIGSPVVFVPRGVLEPVNRSFLEEIHNIRIVEVDDHPQFPKDELLEMKDKIYDIAHTIPKSVIPEDVKEVARRVKSRTAIKKKKAKRRQQKQARRNSRK